MIDTDWLLLATNVLIYAAFADSPHHRASSAVLEQAGRGDEHFYISIQTLYEFYSTVTNPRRMTDPISGSEANEIIDIVLSMPGIHLLFPTAATLDHWLSLVRKYPCVGPDVFDYQLAALARTYGLRGICTFNRSDFERLGGFSVVVPSL